MAKKPTVQTEDKYVIRFPEGMRDALKAEAEKNNRSMNAEIIARLEEHPALSQMKEEVPHLKADKERLANELAHARKLIEEHRKLASQMGHLAEQATKEAKREEERMAELFSAKELYRERFYAAEKAARKSQEVIRRLVNLLVRTLGVEESAVDSIKTADDEED